MKKNIDPNKVSNFKNRDFNDQHSNFCMKTKPNNRYFNAELKRLTQEMRDNLCTEQLKKKNPPLYYSMMNRKLPKKYHAKEKVQIAPVNAYVPPQSKLSTEELDVQLKKEADAKKLKDQIAFKDQQDKMKEKQRLAYNEAAFYKQQKIIHWCNAHDQGRWRSIHSEEYKSKTEKKYEYYW